MPVTEGLTAAFRAAGGARALARKLGIARGTISDWKRVPEARVMEVERLTGVAAETLRPDLASAIRITRQGQALARARDRHSFAGFSARASSPGQARAAIDLFEVGLIIAAVQFAAIERALDKSEVLHGLGFEERSARAYGLALAFVVGRVSSALIAQVVGTTRQNVENAGERYLRARDGDDEDDLEDGYRIERGRKRQPKDGDEQLWAAEQRFLEWLEGRI